jgi:uncharacterized OB-fold protein
MPIRKGHLHRICHKCGDSYYPKGIASRVCEKCNPQSEMMRKWSKKI